MLKHKFANDRAVSTVIGAILIFGILVTSYAIYQGEIVPSQNENVEAKHSEKVQDQLLTLRNNIQETGFTGSKKI